MAEQLENTADFYGREVEVKLRRLTSYFEPAVIIVVGVVVGFVAIALVQAMYGSLSGGGGAAVSRRARTRSRHHAARAARRRRADGHRVRRGVRWHGSVPKTESVQRTNASLDADLRTYAEQLLDAPYRGVRRGRPTTPRRQPAGLRRVVHGGLLGRQPARRRSAHVRHRPGRAAAHDRPVGHRRRDGHARRREVAMNVAASAARRPRVHARGADHRRSRLMGVISRCRRAALVPRHPHRQQHLHAARPEQRRDGDQPLPHRRHLCGGGPGAA